MKTITLVVIMLFAAPVFCGTAWAQYNLRTSPIVPTAGQPFQVVFEDTECEVFFLSAPGAPPTVIVQGTTVTVEADRTQVLDCSSPAFTYTIPMPPLAQGAYTLQLVARIMGNPGNQVVEDSVALQIAGAASSEPSTIPATDDAVLVTLALLLLAGSLTGWRGRR